MRMHPGQLVDRMCKSFLRISCLCVMSVASSLAANVYAMGLVYCCGQALPMIAGRTGFQNTVASICVDVKYIRAWEEKGTHGHSAAESNRR